MATRHDRTEVLEEHQRLMRALIESFETESDLHRQLRTVKEQLVNSVLRFQISARMSEADEETITALRNEVSEAKRKAMVSDKQSSTATSIIQQLNNEISSLKKHLREAHLVNLASPNLSSDAANGNLIASADREVEQMVYRAATPHVSQVVAKAMRRPESLTPFQQWKVDKFVWSPDTPAGSTGFDKQMGEASALNDTFMRDFASFSLQRPTQSRLGKVRTTSPKSRDRQRLQVGTTVSLPLPSLHMSTEDQARLMGLASGVSSTESLNFDDTWEGELAGSESLYPMPQLEEQKRRQQKAMRTEEKDHKLEQQQASTRLAAAHRPSGLATISDNNNNSNNNRALQTAAAAGASPSNRFSSLRNSTSAAALRPDSAATATATSLVSSRRAGASSTSNLLGTNAATADNKQYRKVAVI